MPVIEFDVWCPDMCGWKVDCANSAVVFRLPHKKLVTPILYNSSHDSCSDNHNGNCDCCRSDATIYTKCYIATAGCCYCCFCQLHDTIVTIGVVIFNLPAAPNEKACAYRMYPEFEGDELFSLVDVYKLVEHHGEADFDGL